MSNIFVARQKSPRTEFNLNLLSGASPDYGKLNNIAYSLMNQLRLDALCILNLSIVNSNYYVSSKHNRTSVNSFNPVAASQSSLLCWAPWFDRKDQKADWLLQTKYLGNSRCDIAAFYSKPRLCYVGSINIIK